MLKLILLAIPALVAVVLIVAALRPDQFRVTRSARIAAPPAAVFGHVNDLHQWEKYSPWSRLDPQARTSYDGPQAGTGAVFRWAGNKEVGEGTMTIVDSRPGELVRFRLDFLKPMAATSTAEFTFQAQGDGTLVTWAMHGHSNFVCRVFGLFMNMDQMIGGHFEAGLANLKALAENSTPVLAQN